MKFAEKPESREFSTAPNSNSGAVEILDKMQHVLHADNVWYRRRRIRCVVGNWETLGAAVS